MKRILLLVLLCVCTKIGADDITVVTIQTPLGSFDVEMLEDAAPATVANFLNYVNRGDYNTSFLHRSVPGFIVQGGGFFFDPELGALPINSDPPVINEFNVSNTRGTMAMAKLGSDPNSATNQWFVNLADNSENLDNQNGGFTVFGRVLGDGMDVVDAIAGLDIVNVGAPFDNLPVINFSGGTVLFENLVNIQVSASTPPDTDGDGLHDDVDPDDDNDGVDDEDDAFPLDENESLDTDGDGTGNNADPDDDGDGVADGDDAFPLDEDESVDTDMDGIGNNADDDDDGDGIADSEDAFPLDDAESVDSDGDGTGDNADTDDDGDGMPDAFEFANGFDPLDDSDANLDADDDGATNLQEFTFNTDPHDADSVEACLGTDVVPPNPVDSLLLTENRLCFANPASNVTQQTFLRFINPNETSTDIELYAIDDAGLRSKRPPISFTLAPQASKQINAQELEAGNTNKGLTSNFCNGQGKWQLQIRSNNTVQVMSLIRTPDGFLTSVNDTVPKSGDDNLAFFSNPASNVNQQTFLRIVNTSDVAGTVSISAVDDAGISSTTITFELAGMASKQLNAQDLELGNAGKGLTGSLGDGVGKWRLNISSVLDLKVMSLIRTPDGFLTNLSGMVAEAGPGVHIIYFGNPASTIEKQTFLRIINTSGQSSTITISAVDDAGDTAPSGDITFVLATNESKQMNAGDLEFGNAAKGLSGMLGSGTGRWRLTVGATTVIEVMSLIRTPDGFLTNLSRTTPVAGDTNEVLIFNPASNINQRSSLRMINHTNSLASVTISGFDDSGAPAPGGELSFTIAADSAIELTAPDIESGNIAKGLTGALGDGTGKWRLKVVSTTDLQVQSLLNTPSGFLTNLSRASE